jgi:hypothetical protein
MHLNRISLLHDFLGTADGRCPRCGAFLSVSIPSEGSAIDALSRLFDEHLREKHTEPPNPESRQ